jgi:HicB family
MVTTPVPDLLAQAEELARTAPTWADLSNALFDPEGGLLARALPTAEARAAFVRTDDYRQIRQLVTRAIERFGLVAGGTPAAGGSLVVPLPPAVHAALQTEAAKEGVSLPQWVLTKLSLPLQPSS